MAVTVFPETGDGLTAAAVALLNDASLGAEDRRVSGLVVSDGGSLYVSVSAGVAYIGGVRVLLESAASTVLANNVSNFVWLEPDGDVVDNTSTTPPTAGSLLLARVDTSGGAIDTIYNLYNPANGKPQHVGNRTVYKRKQFDESVISNTTLQNDNELLLVGAVGEVWEIEVFMEVDHPDYSAGFKLGFTAPSGRFSGFGHHPETEDDAFFTAFGLQDNDASATISDSMDAKIGASAGASDIDALPVSLRGVWAVGDTAGTFYVQWAQLASYAGNTTVKAGSWLLARRIG